MPVLIAVKALGLKGRRRLILPGEAFDASDAERAALLARGRARDAEPAPPPAPVELFEPAEPVKPTEAAVPAPKRRRRGTYQRTDLRAED